MEVLVVGFGLGLRYPAVEVHGGGREQIDPRGLIYALGGHARVVEYGDQELQQLYRIAVLLWEVGGGCLLHEVREVARLKSGLYLGLGVVVVNPIGEPHAFEVDFKGFPLGIVCVALVAAVDPLEDVADGQVVLIVLVPEDIAPAERGLA